MVKNLPAMQETPEMRFQSLDWKDPLEEGMNLESRPVRGIHVQTAGL